MWLGPIFRSRRFLSLPTLAILCAVALAVPAAWARPPGTYAVGYDIAVRVNADRTGEIVETRRVWIGDDAGAPQRLGQQSDAYIDGMHDYAILAAFTQKPDGRRIDVDPASVITRDAAQATNAVYMRDTKTVTLLFPDVAPGDLLVMTARKTIRATVFPGHFQLLLPLPRTSPYAESTVTVTAPASLKLAVGGTGFAHLREVRDDEIRHVLTYAPQPVLAAEDRMTSSRDRDPNVSISTFAGLEDMARSYWSTARTAIDATPAIAALADEITAGIADRRDQAAAISRWMKANIRYVMVVLGASRVVPNHADMILRNRFGDCKDQVVLMSSLLAAKGIAAEHVLIGAGNGYTLPEPATLGHINHVMIHLPEFGIYDDPTASLADFGILAAETYDKPVLHVSDAGVGRSRTPAMTPDDHMSLRHTRLAIAADGSVSGESLQLARGIFAMGARVAVRSLQWNGLDKAVATILRGAGMPGSGRLEVATPDGPGGIHELRASFTYDERLAIRPGASVVVPAGVGTLVRPGTFLLASRVPARQLPFVCFAGRQIEEVAVTLADGLPLPQKPADRRIETPALVYTVAYRLDGRTLTIRREFLSRVAGQVCPPDMEAALAGPMATIAADNEMRISFARPAPVATSGLRRPGIVDEPLALDFVQAVDPDCVPIGVVRVSAATPPGRGTLSIAPDTGFVTYPPGDARAACNRRRMDGISVVYRPAPGHVGDDNVRLDILYADGSTAQRSYAISVGPRPEPREFRRAAVAGQRTRIAFLHDVARDCAVLPFADIRIVEEPRHGAASIEPGTGFPAYDRTSPRAACNAQRVEGMALIYRSRDGHVGADSVAIDIVDGDGRVRRIRYAIDIE
jgi:hypothetical protein